MVLVVMVVKMVLLRRRLGGSGSNNGDGVFGGGLGYRECPLALRSVGLQRHQRLRRSGSGGDWRGSRRSGDDRNSVRDGGSCWHDERWLLGQ